MKKSRLFLHAVHGPWGRRSQHLTGEELVEGLEKLSPPGDVGSLALIVTRGDDGHRETPERTTLTPEGGVPGDAWLRDDPGRMDTQIALMRADVAELVAAGQPLTLFGDNLLVDLDLSFDNLPAGSRFRVGAAELEVTPEPHDGCLKFKQRFGGDALRFTAAPDHKHLRLRGIYAKVVLAGEVSVGDRIEVLSRGDSASA
ncbi:MAG: MOSC domain-containing protein [Myxococcales bacterium]|nr:MOSC domain-containing protein [Myxococcales bacterium]